VSSSTKNNVSVINTTTNTVVATTVAVGKIAQQNATLSLKSAHHSPAQPFHADLRARQSSDGFSLPLMGCGWLAALESLYPLCCDPNSTWE